MSVSVRYGNLSAERLAPTTVTTSRRGLKPSEVLEMGAEFTAKRPKEQDNLDTDFKSTLDLVIEIIFWRNGLKLRTKYVYLSNNV